MAMNIGEGLRRIGLVAGFIGAALSCTLAYERVVSLVEDFHKNEEFQTLLRRPAVERDIKAARQAPADPPETLPADWFERNTPAQGKGRGKYKITEIEQRPSERDQGWKPPEVQFDPDAFMKQRTSERDQGWRPPGMGYVIQDDIVKAVFFGENREVAALETAGGQRIEDTPAPAITAYLALLFFPLLGFLLPWGTIRTLSWVVTGFIQAKT